MTGEPTVEARAADRRWLEPAGLALLVLAGLALRLRGLGALPLGGDEGIQALAVRGILEFGIPKVESGLVYIHALLLLYGQAALARLASLDPYWLRLPSALCGAAVVVPAYLLARDLFGRKVAVISAALLAFSTWEIELSRYARSYAVFQMLYVASLLFFFRGFLRDERPWRVAFLVTASVALWTHHLSVLLFLCFLVPLPLASLPWRRKLASATWMVALGAGLWVERYVVRLLHAHADPFDPPAFAAPERIDPLHAVRAFIGLPGTVAPELEGVVALASEAPWLLTALGLAGLAAAVPLVRQAVRELRPAPAFFGLLALGCAVTHQFGLALVLLALHLVLAARDAGEVLRPPLRSPMVVVVVLLVAWCAIFALLVPLGAKATVYALFGFPPLIKYLFFWLAAGWPVMGLALVAGCAMLLGRFLPERRDAAALFVLGSLFLPAVGASLFVSYAESRYVFHLYPLIAIVYALVAATIGERLRPAFAGLGWGASLAGLVMALFLSQDANPLAAWRAANRGFAGGKDPYRSTISWKLYGTFHQDLESPARHVAEHRAPGDRVVLLGPVHVTALLHYYLGGPDVTLVPENEPYYYARVRGGRRIHYITGSPLVSGVEELDALIASGPGATWLLGDRLLLEATNPFYSEAVRAYLRPRVAASDHVGRDGQTFAVRIDRPAATAE